MATESVKDYTIEDLRVRVATAHARTVQRFLDEEENSDDPRVGAIEVLEARLVELGVFETDREDEKDHEPEPKEDHEPEPKEDQEPEDKEPSEPEPKDSILLDDLAALAPRIEAAVESGEYSVYINTWLLNIKRALASLEDAKTTTWPRRSEGPS